MANRIQLRRGNGQEWQNSNPILAQGELGIELDTGRFKIGDGVTPWNTLRYERPIESTSNTANTLVQRDNDGNFSAATITATLIGNASTSSRLASSRQIQLIGDVGGSQIFDGSENISISATLDLLSSLPHHDNTETSTGTYTKVTVDAKGRVTNASNPTTLADYNLNGTVEGSSAQAYDLDLVALAGLTTTGFISRTASNTMATRTITGTAGKINVNNGGGLAGNPTLDLATTTVTAGDYNTESLTSVAGSETVNATKFSVDDRGRLTSATTVPIATAVEGTTALDYAAGTTYARYDIIKNASKVYQAITGIAAGQGAPTHNDTSDAGGWRYLAAESTEQKGLASFAQEDFDVASGHVSIATAGVDNPQLQNSRISFADGNAVEHFDLDQELTATTGYRGLNKLNYVKVNDTSGNLLFGANNTGDGGAGEVDINARLYFSDADITFDGGVNQTLSKTGDGHLTFGLSQDSSSARNLSITAVNAGTGASGVIVTAEDSVAITASDAAGKVQVEDMYFQGDYIASSAATMILDPGDDRAVSGKVQIMGDLQVDGTTTTINSTITTLDDPIITLGGDTAPGSDDNKDRGVEFRYYDTQARVGFFGYDDSAADLGGHTGAFTFLYNATNTSEVFSGTDAGIIAGNLSLTTNTNSTSNTTGDLVVAGGAGIGDDVNIGGSVDIDTNLTVHGTTLHDDNIVIQGASKVLQLNNGSGTNRIELQSTTGNASFYGVVDITNNLNINSNKFNVVAASGNTAIAGTLTVSDATTIKADGKYFKIQTANATDKFTVDTDNGDTNTEGKLNVADLVHIESTDNPNIVSGAPHTIGSADYGALRVDGGGYFDKDVLFNGDLYLNGDFNQQEDATENYGLRNYLSVRYKLRTGSVAAYTPSYSNHNTSNLRVFGGAGVNTSLHVGGTGSGEGFFVGKKNNGDSIKFQVLGASGDITSEGDLVQNGNSEFNGTVDVDADFAVRSGTTDKFFVDNATGDTNIEGTLTVDGAAELNSTLNVDAGATFQDNVTINADNKMFKIQNNSSADKFTVDTDNGNTETQGTLTVQGQTNIIDSLIINAANEVFDVQDGSANSKFSVDTDNGNTNISGTLDVSLAAGINNTLGVTGITSITNNTQQTLTGSYAADGSLQVTGGVGIARDTAIGGSARVYGNLETTGTLTQTDDAAFAGKITITDTKDITSFADAQVSLTTAGGARVDKNLYTGGDFIVYDTVGTQNSFFVDTSSGNAEVRNNFQVGGNLTVLGSTTTVESTVTTVEDPVMTLGGATAPTSNDGLDRGIEFRYYDTAARIGFLGWDNNLNTFRLLTDATNSAETFSGTDGTLQVGAVNITGAGTALDVDNNVNVDGTITVDGQLISQVSSGPALVIPNTVKITNLNADLLDGMTTATAATNSTVVARDSSGDFSAHIITVESAAGAGAGIQGNATSADVWKTARTLTIDGVVNGSVSVNGSADFTVTTTYDDADITALAGMSGTGLVARTAANTYAQRTIQVSGGGIGITNGGGVAGDPSITITSNSANSANNLVIRDASGNFAAGVITASLTGSVTGNVTGNLLAATTDSKNIKPDTDSSYTLGTTTHRWSKIWTDDIEAGGTITGNVTGNLTGDVTGNADTATALETARNIGGVSFDGTAAINLPGVNTAGNQDTSGNAATATALATARNIGGTAFDGTGDITPATATQAANLNNHDTADLAEGTNLYYTEARVQAKLDNAYAQLSAMLNNLATSTTLTLNLSGDPTPGTVVSLGSITASGLGGFSAGTAVATSGGTGTGLTVDTTVNAAGAITALAVNGAGSGYLIGDNLQITNPNLGGVSTLNLGTLSGGVGGFSSATGVATTGGSGSGLTFDTTVDGNGNITNIAVNAPGTGYANGETITVVNANAGGASTVDTLVGGTGYANGTAIATTGGSGSGLTLNLTTSNGVVTNAAINAAGTGYAVDDTITIVNANATGVRTLGSIATAGTGYAAGSGIATTASGSGTGLTADITVDGNGAVTGVTINDDGSGYANAETITITNANASGVKTLGSIASGGTGYGTGTALATTSSGSGTGLTVDVTVTNGVVDGVSINNDGSGYAASEVITIANANASGVNTLGTITAAGSGYSAGSAIATTSGGSGTGLTVDITVNGSGGVTGVTVNNDGLNYANSDSITITNANASGVATLGSITAAASGYSAGTVATTTGGSGSGLTVTVAVNGSGSVTGMTIVNDGSGYAASDTITLTNANATGVETLNSIMVAGTGYPASQTITGVSTTTNNSGTGLTLDITTNSSGHVVSAVINNDGTGYAASDTITIDGSGDGNAVTGVAAIHGNATTTVGAIHGSTATLSVGAIHGNGATIPVSAIHGNSATIPVSAIHGNSSTIDIATIFANATINTATVFTHATFALADITTMEVGATVTGATSGTTGVITAMGTSLITVDNVDGFFKVGEAVAANDVTTLTISSFA